MHLVRSFTSPASLHSPPDRAPHSDEQGPLRELLLNDQQIEHAAHCIRTQGFFEVALSNISMAFLKEVPANTPELQSRWSSIESTREFPIGLPDTAVPPEFKSELTKTAQRLFTQLCELQHEVPLRAQDFCVRIPSEQAASQWHVDKAPKVLTMFATVEGSPTQYLLPPYDHEAVDVRSVPSRVKDEALLAEHLQHCKPGHVYIIAPEGVNQHGSGSGVHQLVHRAPGDWGRLIMLLRWATAPAGSGSSSIDGDREQSNQGHVNQNLSYEYATRYPKI